MNQQVSRELMDPSTASRWAMSWAVVIRRLVTSCRRRRSVSVFFEELTPSRVMTTKTTRILFKALMEMSKEHSSKVLSGNIKRPNIKHLATSGSLVVGRTNLALCPASPLITPRRSFINLAAPIAARRMEYTECRTLGYTPEQLYNVVADVDRYQHFVPWCKRSRVIKGRSGDFQAELEIGFPPIVDRYTSEVTVIPNHKVKAVCSDASFFRHLETIWRFSPGANNLPACCKVEFHVSFEFKSLLHSQLASVFFDDVVKQMVNAFDLRAATLYSNQQGAVKTRRPP